MAAVTNITELANAILMDAVADVASPAFVKKNISMNHMMTIDMPTTSNIKKIKKNGTLTAASLVQATALAVGADGELSDTSVSLTAAKAVVSSGLAIESEKFGGHDVPRMSKEAMEAIARFVDDDFLSLFSGLSASVTSTTVMTVNDIALGLLGLYNAKVPNQEVAASIFLGPTAVHNIRKEIRESGAAQWSNTAALGILNGAAIPANGFVGSIAGIGDVYQTTGFATGGSDDTQAIFHPMWTFAGMFDTAPTVWLTPVGAGGGYKEIFVYYFWDQAEINDLAGTALKSDT